MKQILGNERKLESSFITNHVQSAHHNTHQARDEHSSSQYGASFPGGSSYAYQEHPQSYDPNYYHGSYDDSSNSGYGEPSEIHVSKLRS